MSIPTAYNIDFTSDYQDLQGRAQQRLLLQFRRSVLMNALLGALVSEIQVLSDAIVDVMKYRTLAYVQGVNIDVVGRIVGQPRQGVALSTTPLLTEDGFNFILEDGSADILAVQQEILTALGDADYLQLILLRIASNFTRSCSIPEITAAIKQATGVTAQIRNVGPAQIDVMVSPDTAPSIAALIEQRMTTYKGDDIYLFPFPATSLVQVATNTYLLTEDGQNFLLENGSQLLITEDIPL